MDRIGSRLTTHFRRGLTARCFAVAIVVAAGLALALPLGYLLSGPLGVWAALTGAGVCLLSTLLSLWMGHLMRAPHLALHSLLIGMLVRMGLPLALGLVLHSRVAALAEGGMMYYLLGFYLLCLAAHTLLTLPEVSSSPANQKGDVAHG